MLLDACAFVCVEQWTGCARELEAEQKANPAATAPKGPATKSLCLQSLVSCRSHPLSLTRTTACSICSAQQRRPRAKESCAQKD